MVLRASQVNPQPTLQPTAPTHKVPLNARSNAPSNARSHARSNAHLSSGSLDCTVGTFVLFLLVFAFMVMAFLLLFTSTFQSTITVWMAATALFALGLVVMDSFPEFSKLVARVHPVRYAIAVALSLLALYAYTPAAVLTAYQRFWNPVLVLVCAVAFFKAMVPPASASSSSSHSSQTVLFARIHMAMVLFCVLAVMLAVNNVNPAGTHSIYAPVLLLVVAVFAFLYLLILLAVPSSSAASLTPLGSYASVGFVVFLITAVSGMVSKRASLFGSATAPSSTGATAIMLLLCACVLGVSLLGTSCFSELPTRSSSHSSDRSNMETQPYILALLLLFGLVLFALFTVWTVHAVGLASVNSWTSPARVGSFVLNLALILLVLSLVYQTVHTALPSKRVDANKNNLVALLVSVVYYLPCLAGDLLQLLLLVLAQLRNTQDPAVRGLAVVAGLAGVYAAGRAAVRAVSLQGGRQLVNQPVHTTTQYALGNYETLSGSSTYDYTFALSCWIFIDAAPPNMSPAYTRFASLLSYGNKPAIAYCGETHTLRITVQQKDLQDTTQDELVEFDERGHRVVYSTDEVLLQKWTNIIVNYAGGTMDVFVDGRLVRSSIGVVPYHTIDSLTVGETGGLQGGICNVVYFSRTLSAANIYYVYNSAKDLTPPTPNSSPDAVLAQI